MFSAAVFVRKWSIRRANRIRQRFRPVGTRTDYTSASGALDDNALQVDQHEKKPLDITLRLSESEEKKESCNSSSTNEVTYNRDEDRFTQEFTLNLKTFSLYKISVELDENFKLEYFSLGRKSYFNVLEKYPKKEFFDILNDPTKGIKIYSFVS